MNLFRKASVAAMPAVFAVLSLPSLEAAVSLGTTGIYDAGTNANIVENTGTTSGLTLAAFSASVSTAYAANLGGVINFDIDGAGTVRPGSFIASDNQLNVTYGASALNTLSITRPNSSAYQFDMSASFGATPISGAFYLRSAVLGANPPVNTNYHIFNFSTGLDAVGFTILARTGARSGNIVLTYSDTTSDTASFSVATVSGAGPDTFYGFQAPNGKSITALTIAPSNGDFVAIDDLGFIVPEPSAALLFFSGSLTLLRRRRAC